MLKKKYIYIFLLYHYKYKKVDVLYWNLFLVVLFPIHVPIVFAVKQDPPKARSTRILVQKLRMNLILHESKKY